MTGEETKPVQTGDGKSEAAKVYRAPIGPVLQFSGAKGTIAFSNVDSVALIVQPDGKKCLIHQPTIAMGMSQEELTKAGAYLDLNIAATEAIRTLGNQTANDLRNAMRRLDSGQLTPDDLQEVLSRARTPFAYTQANPEDLDKLCPAPTSAAGNKPAGRQK